MKTSGYNNRNIKKMYQLIFLFIYGNIFRVIMKIASVVKCPEYSEEIINQLMVNMYRHD